MAAGVGGREQKAGPLPGAPHRRHTPRRRRKCRRLQGNPATPGNRPRRTRNPRLRRLREQHRAEAKAIAAAAAQPRDQERPQGRGPPRGRHGRRPPKSGGASAHSGPSSRRTRGDRSRHKPLPGWAWAEPSPVNPAEDMGSEGEPQETGERDRESQLADPEEDRPSRSRRRNVGRLRSGGLDRCSIRTRSRPSPKADVAEIQPGSSARLRLVTAESRSIPSHLRVCPRRRHSHVAGATPCPRRGRRASEEASVADSSTSSGMGTAWRPGSPCPSAGATA